MFDFLKKKISGFLSGITKDKEAAATEKTDEKFQEKAEAATQIEEIEEQKTEELEEESKKLEIELNKEEKVLSQKIKETKKQNLSKRVNEPQMEQKKPDQKDKKEMLFQKKDQKINKEERVVQNKVEKYTGDKKEAGAIKKPIEVSKSEKESRLVEEEKEKERVKIGFTTKLKNLFSSTVEISEGDLKSLEDFELELLEADVDLDIAQQIKDTIKEKLLKKRIEKNKLHNFVTDTIRETLVEILDNEKKIDFLKLSNEKKPLKIMFIGVNGAGKTTTIAKVAKYFLDNNKKVVLAAADTFRAAAIEQLAVHAQNLGVRLIKREYGSDPTSVAFDAVNYANAHSIDVVLIDTAGRQDTNLSLLNEMKKMSRVISPDLKVYIGESIAGNAIIEQIKSFNREIGLDSVILTKLDCDAKGGTMLSINKATGVPIAYIGIGQKYEDLEKFDAQIMAKRIVN